MFTDGTETDVAYVFKNENPFQVWQALERELTGSEGATARRKRNWVKTISKQGLHSQGEYDMLLTDRGLAKWNIFSSQNKKLVNYIRGFREMTHKTKMHLNLTSYAHDNKQEIPAWLPRAFIIGKKDDDEQRAGLRAMGEGRKWIVKRDDGAWGSNMLVTDNVEEIFTFTAMKTKEVLETRKAKKAAKEAEKALERFQVNEKENKDEAKNGTEFDATGSRGRRSSLADLKAMRKKHYSKNMLSIPWLVQEYLDDPFLINGRKFDVRFWVLLTHDFRIYVHKEGVCRLCSVPYNNDLADQFAHLTNHCLQKNHPDFDGNEMFFPEFKEYLESVKAPWTLEEGVMPQLIEIAKSTILAMRELWVTDQTHSFQLFGYDALIMRDGSVKLLEANASPAIAEHLLADMVSDLTELAIDPVYPPSGFTAKSPPSKENNFQLVFQP